MTKEQLRELYARRPHKARCVKTGETIGFNSLVDLRDALSDGHVVRIGEVTGSDPSRNYRRLTTDQIRQLCQARNVRGFLTMNHELQIKALQELDARDDAALLTGGEPAALPVTDKLPEKPQRPEKASVVLLADHKQPEPSDIVIEDKPEESAGETIE